MNTNDTKDEQSSAGAVEPIEIREGTYWKHPSGIDVYVTGTGFQKPEDSPFNTEAWIPAVMYKNYSGTTPETIFSRSRDSFLKKFKPV